MTTLTEGTCDTLQFSSIGSVLKPVSERERERGGGRGRGRGRGRERERESRSKNKSGIIQR